MDSGSAFLALLLFALSPFCLATTCDFSDIRNVRVVRGVDRARLATNEQEILKQIQIHDRISFTSKSGNTYSNIKVVGIKRDSTGNIVSFDTENEGQLFSLVARKIDTPSIQSNGFKLGASEVVKSDGNPVEQVLNSLRRGDTIDLKNKSGSHYQGYTVETAERGADGNITAVWCKSPTTGSPTKFEVSKMEINTLKLSGSEDLIETKVFVPAQTSKPTTIATPRIPQRPGAPPYKPEPGSPLEKDSFGNFIIANLENLDRDKQAAAIMAQRTQLVFETLNRGDVLNFRLKNSNFMIEGVKIDRTIYRPDGTIESVVGTDPKGLEVTIKANDVNPYSIELK